VALGDVRLAPKKCRRHELPLNPESVAGDAMLPEGSQVNRQPVTA
jgi:hypothetical protein